MKLEGYVRVSRVGGRAGDGYISPSVQRDSIEAYATEIGGEIVEWHTDEDFSGGTTNRPGFQAALTRIHAGHSDGIVVMRIDRFARSVADGATIVRDLTDNGKTFAAVQERINPQTPEGKYMLTAFLANAELFLDQSKASWKIAKARAVERGAPIGPTPFGYLRVRAVPTTASHVSPVQAAALAGQDVPVGTLTPNPTAGTLVTEMFRRSAAGEPVGEIAGWLEREHPKPSARGWSANDIRRILSRRVYLGEVRYGDLLQTGCHPPLTDPASFTAAQPGPARAKRKGSSLTLTGLLHCANCGNRMSGNTFGGPDGGTPVYRCGAKCGNGSVIVASRIETYIFDLARSGIRQALAGRKAAGVTGGLAKADTAITEAEAELDAFVSNLTVRRTLGDARWEEGIQLRAANVTDAQRERQALLDADRLADIDVDRPTDHDLRRFAFAAIDRVNIRRGRLPVAERCEIVFRQDHHPGS